MGTSLLTRDAQPITAASPDRVDSDWRLFYRIAGVAALISIACIVLGIPIFLLNPIPTSITGWFALYQSAPLIGLFDGDLMMLVSYVMMGIIYLGLFGALRRSSEPLALLATALGLMSVVLYIAINPAFSVYGLSSQYAATTDVAERAQLLGAGQAVITNWQGSSFDVSYLLAALTALIFGAIMLRRAEFSKWAAYSAIAMGALGLVPATAGMVGIVFSLVSLLPALVWLVLIALRFFQLGRAK
ncbi:MAG TPA: hypothetical protein VF808_09980 [Ktedonobacterales bacterium]